MDSTGTLLRGHDGSIRWALDAVDMCDLLELAVDLLAEWGAEPPSGVWARAAGLLGATVQD